MQQDSAMNHLNQQLIAEQRANAELKKLYERLLFDQSDVGHELLQQVEELKRQLQCKVREREREVGRTQTSAQRPSHAACLDAT